MKPNPPKKPARRRRAKTKARTHRGTPRGAAARRAGSARKPKAKRGPVLRAFKLGTAIRLTYRHRQDGTNRYHNFARGTVLAYSADRQFLIIKAPVQDFIR